MSAAGQAGRRGKGFAGTDIWSAESWAACDLAEGDLPEGDLAERDPGPGSFRAKVVRGQGEGP